MLIIILVLVLPEIMIIFFNFIQMSYIVQTGLDYHNATFGKCQGGAKRLYVKTFCSEKYAFSPRKALYSPKVEAK